MPAMTMGDAPATFAPSKKRPGSEVEGMSRTHPAIAWAIAPRLLVE